MNFPALPTDWEPTRALLHAHTATAGVVARAHAPAHPKWWHVSLTVTDRGLTTSAIPLDDGRSVTIVVDPTTHMLRLEVDGDATVAYPLSDAPSDVAAALFAALADVGLADTYDRSRLHEDPDGPYDPEHASGFWNALRSVRDALEDRRAARPGEPGPVQVWPHGFDIAFEWFGSRLIENDEASDPGSQSAQLNLGWYPAGDAYFYSNPWPFEDSLTDISLPEPAVWHTEGWLGTMLRYDDVVGDPDGLESFTAYADAVFDAATPLLEG